MAFVIPGVLAALVLLWAIVSFNRFVAQRQIIDNSWSNVETELRRRHDLIPNLVETVRGYASHESDTLREVIEARTGAVGAVGGPDAHQGVENLLTAGLRHLFAVSEAYPTIGRHATGLRMGAPPTHPPVHTPSAPRRRVP